MTLGYFFLRGHEFDRATTAHGISCKAADFHRQQEQAMVGVCYAQNR